MDSATAVKAALFTMALLLVSAAPRSSFAQTAVDTEIVLAVDVSDSVSYPRFILQRRGYAEAFRNPEVLNADRTEIDVQPGRSKDLWFVATTPGAYKLACPDHDWAGMVGDITIAP